MRLPIISGKAATNDSLCLPAVSVVRALGFLSESAPMAILKIRGEKIPCVLLDYAQRHALFALFPKESAWRFDSRTQPCAYRLDEQGNPVGVAWYNGENLWVPISLGRFMDKGDYTSHGQAMMYDLVQQAMQLSGVFLVNFTGEEA